MALANGGLSDSAESRGDARTCRKLSSCTNRIDAVLSRPTAGGAVDGVLWPNSLADQELEAECAGRTRDDAPIRLDAAARKWRKPNRPVSGLTVHNAVLEFWPESCPSKNFFKKPLRISAVLPTRNSQCSGSMHRLALAAFAFSLEWAQNS